MKVVEAGHPIPDGAQVAYKAAMALPAGRGKRFDCIVSGGASALLSCPVMELSLPVKQKTTDTLLHRAKEFKKSTQSVNTSLKLKAVGSPDWHTQRPFSDWICRMW